MPPRNDDTGLSRRRFLRTTVLGLGGLAAGGLLAACTTTPAATPAPTTAATKAAGATAAPAATSVAGATTTAAATTQAPATAAAKPYAGQTIKVSMFDTSYPRGLQNLIPRFREQTGIGVDLELLGFTIFLQRADLDLSGATGSTDAMTLVFAQSGRWMGANWAENLNPYISRTSFDIPDFLPGPMAAMKQGDNVYGIPWLADSQLMLYRRDLINKAPETFEELLATARSVHSTSVGAYMPAGKAGMNWVFPTFQLGFGGKIFENPPQDMRPGYASDASINAADYWAGNLLRNFGVPGSTNFEDAEGIATMQQGRAAIWIHSLGQLVAATEPGKSTVADKVAFAMPPRGPAGLFPQVATHGLMIPVASRKKDAAWEFIRWATSRDVMRQVSLEAAHSAVTRASVLADAQFKQKYQIAGSDVPALHQAALQETGKGYMAYRTRPEFPAITERVNQALSAIAAGQQPARDAMTQVNNDALQILERAGHKVR
ncbi:MAG: extracellular solute-binding protein [Chloroflexota bacterium]